MKQHCSLPTESLPQWCAAVSDIYLYEDVPVLKNKLEIRHAIGETWKRGDAEAIRRFFGSTVETGEMGRPVLSWSDGTTEPATPIQSYHEDVSGSDLRSECGMTTDQTLALSPSGRRPDAAVP